MFEQLGYSLQKSEDILTGHQYFSPFSTQLFHLGLSVVCSIQDAKITHIKCEIFMYRNVEFHGISHSILTDQFPICPPRCHVCSYTIIAFTSFYQNFFVLWIRWLIAKYNLLRIMLTYYLRPNYVPNYTYQLLLPMFENRSWIGILHSWCGFFSY